MLENVAAVAIGRNEGDRLKLCLNSLVAKLRTVVYVDSGSTDGSVEFARSLGVHVVELDMTSPFTAARARNEGFRRVVCVAPTAKYVFFIDGDCQMTEGWPSAATSEFNRRPEVAVVCGRLRERHPEHSVYNRIADLEWDAPLGEIDASGGVFVIRSDVFDSAGRFEESIRAGEEPELCQRVRANGFKVVRLPDEMARHDIAMTHFCQWWRRQIRNAYGALDVATRFGLRKFRRHVFSATLWAIGWPLSLLMCGLLLRVYFGGLASVVGVAIVMLILPLQILRVSRAGKKQGLKSSDALAYGALTIVSKWAHSWGHLRYWFDRCRGTLSSTISFKDHSS